MPFTRHYDVTQAVSKKYIHINTIHQQCRCTAGIIEVGQANPSPAAKRLYNTTFRSTCQPPNDHQNFSHSHQVSESSLHLQEGRDFPIARKQTNTYNTTAAIPLMIKVKTVLATTCLPMICVQWCL